MNYLDKYEKYWKDKEPKENIYHLSHQQWDEIANELRNRDQIIYKNNEENAKLRRIVHEMDREDRIKVKKNIIFIYSIVFTVIAIVIITCGMEYYKLSIVRELGNKGIDTFGVGLKDIVSIWK